MIGYQKQDGSDGVAVESVYKPDGGVKNVATINDKEAFDLDLYKLEFTGKSCADSKRMLDIYYDLPDWMKDLIDNSIEMKAVDMDSYISTPKNPSDSGGLSDLAKDDDDDENIPF